MPTDFGPVSVNLDFSFWNNILTWSSGQLLLAIFGIIGWAILILVFFFMGEELWLWYRQGLHTSQWRWHLLAIDIPLEVTESPKAVEQLFAQLSGALVTPNIGEKYWQGKKQKWFSFEIVSMAGYIQFLIYTEAEFRDVVESAIYAQYPSAGITEIEDYAPALQTKFPADESDVFGVEFKLANNSAYPIRTYPEFEHSVSKDTKFNDPMAAILENFTRIGAGENFFTQIILEPAADVWQEGGIGLVKEIIERKDAAAKSSILGFIGSAPLALLGLLSKIWAWNFEAEEAAKKDDPAKGKVSELPPGLKNTVQAVEDKISKVGFKCKIRALYSASREVFNPGRCLNGYIGSLKQFNFVGRNSIEPYKATKAHYALKNLRLNWLKRKFVFAFKKRKIKTFGAPYILNVEELATLWHFPLPTVKTPLLQKAASKRTEPPYGLPTETELPSSTVSPEEQDTDMPEPPDLEFG